LYTWATQIERPAIELICGPHPAAKLGVADGRPAIQIKGCLASLGVGVYAGLNALGFSRIRVRTDACAACRWQKLEPTIEKQAEQANVFLAGRGAPIKITCLERIEHQVERPLIQAKYRPLSRRDLFRLNSAQVTPGPAHELTPARTSADQAINSDRLRLMAAAQRLPAPETPESLSIAELDFAVPEVSDSCLACGTCARACPTHALRFETDKSHLTYMLNVETGLCIGCGLCEHGCAPAAITVNHTPVYEQIFPSRVIALKSGALMKCKNCGALIVKRPGVQLCAICATRQNNPFHSSLPPGWKSLNP
jgi:ferredoxin